jgi:cellulose synthase/poly-beta-1,6-N-acetylglucosamine synthase-like glycosyltransferase
MIVASVCITLTIVYVALMLLYRAGWAMQASFQLPKDYEPVVSISIIIPARNEAANIGDCIKAILAQDYPAGLMEVIVVDDHSEDDTYSVVMSFNSPAVKCIRLADYVQEGETINAYKKKAITTGLSVSKGELIITTDADCVAGKNWLQHIAAVYEQQNPVMIVAPVVFACNSSVVQQFQSLDFMSMQGITVASHRLGMGNMCNGANLAFSKQAFFAVDGYTGVEHLASGDDYLLMMKLNKAYPSKIAYLKSAAAIVYTAPQPTWGSFLQQRIRWASKSGKYDDKKMTTILAFVYLFNLSFLVALAIGMWQLLLVMLLVKIVIEIFYLYGVAGFIGKRTQLLLFPFLQPLHIAYIIIAGLLGFVGVYSWKGRRVR